VKGKIPDHAEISQTNPVFAMWAMGKVVARYHATTQREKNGNGGGIAMT